MSGPGPRPARPSAALRWGRRLLAALGLLVLAVVGVTIAGAFWLQTETGREWLLAQILSAANPPNGDLSVRSLETNLLSEVVLHDVALRDASGHTLVEASEVRARYRLGGLPGKVLRVTDLEITGLRGDLAVTDQGLDLANLWPSTTKAGPPTRYNGLGIDILVDRVSVDAPHLRLTAGGETYGLDGATLTGGVRLVGDAVDVDGLSLAAADTQPDLGTLALAGDAHWDPDRIDLKRVDLSVGEQKLQARGSVIGEQVGLQIDALHLVPDALPWALPVTGAFDATGRVSGTTSAPTVALAITTPGGPANVTASADLSKEPLAWSVSADTPGLVVDTFVKDLPSTKVSGRVSAEGTGTDWPGGVVAKVDVDARAEDAAGQGPARLVAKGTLKEGVLDLPGAVAEIGGATVKTDVRLDVAKGSAEARQVSLDVDLAQLARFGVTGLRGRVRFTGRVEGGWSQGTRAHATGAIAGTGLGYETSVDVARATGPVDVTWTGKEARFEGTLATEGLKASASTIPVATLKLTGRAAPGGVLTLDGQARADTLTVGPVGVDATDATLAVAVAGGVPDVKVTATTGAVRADPLHGDRGAASFHLRGQAADFSLDVHAGERLVAGADGDLDLKTKVLNARRLVVAPGPTAWHGDGVQTARLGEDGASDVHLRLVAGDAAIEVDGDAHVMGRMALRATVTRFPMGWLAELDPTAFAGFAGEVDLHGSVEGAADRPDLLAEVDARGLVVPDVVRGLDAHVVAEGHGSGVKLDGTLGEEARPLARFTGTLPVRLDLAEPGLSPGGHVDLHVILPPGELTRWNTFLAREELPRARISAEASLTGPMLHPNLAVVATAEAPAGERGEWVRTDLDLSSAGDDVAMRAVVWQELERRALVSGTARIGLSRVMATLLHYGEPADLKDPNVWIRGLEVSAVPMRLPIQALASLLPVPPALEGDLVGGVHISGTPKRPEVQGALMLVQGRLDRLPLSQASATVEPVDGGYKLGLDLGFGADGALTARGLVPFRADLDSDLSAELRRKGLMLTVDGKVPLAAVAAVWPDLYDAAGALTIDGNVTGSVLAPVPDLRATMEGPGPDDASRARGATFSLVPTGVRYEDVRFDVAMNGDEIRVRDLSMRTEPATGAAPPLLPGQPTANVTGELTVTRQGWEPGTKSGTIHLRDAYLLALPERTIRVDTGDVRVSGEKRQIVLDGKVTLAQARIVADERFFAGTTDLALPAAVVVHREGKVAEARAAKQETLLPRWLAFDLDTDLQSNAFVSAAMPMVRESGDILQSGSTLQVEAQVDGDVSAQARNGDLALTGEVRPVRGTTVVFGKTFQIEEGSTVAFTGGTDFKNPVLDLRAAYDAGEYGTIEVSITGTPETPRIAFSSAQYPSMDDILAILVIGAPTGEMGTTGGETDIVGQLVNALLASQVEEASSSLRLVDLIQVGTDTARIGKRIGPRVFLEVDVNLAADPTKDSVYTATVDVRLPLSMQFEAAYGTKGESQIGLVWTLRW